MFRKELSLKGIAMSVLACVLLVGLYALNVSAQDFRDDDFVFVMSNKNPNNSIIQYRRANNGLLTWIAEVATGGSGTGPTIVDPLGSQDSLVLSPGGLRLFAVNAGSNEISVLNVHAGRLGLLSKSKSGGNFPNSIAVSGDLVYVLNAKSTPPNITGFRVNSAGKLHWITTVDLPSGAVAPNDIRFSHDGTHLLVTASGSNEILVFPLNDDGIASSPVPQTSAGASPFGVRFAHDGIVLVSEAAGSASSYHLRDDMLDVISGAISDTQKTACWITLTRSKHFAYVSNTGSGTISAYHVNGDGELTLDAAVAANTGGAPIDSALSHNSRFFYVLDSAGGRILIYRAEDANLSRIGQVSSLPTSIQGIAAQ
jgi:6-phosphogluconolactonase